MWDTLAPDGLENGGDFFFPGPEAGMGLFFLNVHRLQLFGLAQTANLA